MSTSSRELRLFGLDLPSLWQEIRRPWLEVHQWRIFAWMEPRVQVRLQQADGMHTFWQPTRTGNIFHQVVAGKRGTAENKVIFWAVELPEDLLLRRRLTVPLLSDEQITHALELEARSNSPFPLSDLLWGYGVAGRRENDNGEIAIEVVLASRKQVEGYLQAVKPQGASEHSPEAWVRLNAGTGAFVLNGFGEERRARYAVRWRRITYCLLLVAVGLLFVVGATPTIQLRARALEAVHAYGAMGREVAPLVRLREALAKSTDQTNALAGLLAQRVDPLQVIDMLTKALPDDTVLQRLQIEGRIVRLSGQALNAAALMQQLGAMPEVRDVKAPAAATKPLGAVKENFQIEFALVSSGVPGSGNTGASMAHPAAPQPSVAVSSASAGIKP